MIRFDEARLDPISEMVWHEQQYLKHLEGKLSRATAGHKIKSYRRRVLNCKVRLAALQLSR